MKNNYIRYLKTTLIIIGVVVGIMLLDTLQARIFKHSPIISWKENLEDQDSWVDRGIIIDTYYCTKDEDIITVEWLFKGAKFTCPVDNKEKIEDIKQDSQRKQNIVNLLIEEMINQEKINEENLDTFKVVEILQYGYYRKVPEKKYFQINFEYSCKDQTNSCVSDEYRQNISSDEESYHVVWIYTDEKSIYNLSKGVSIHINSDFIFESDVIN